MILPLRRRHRALMTTLAILLPPAFALSLAWRPKPALPDSPPPALVDAGPLDCARPLPDGGWDGLPVLARVGFRRGDAALRVEVRATAPIRRPDLLLYWRPAGDGLDGAVLLGPFAGALTAPLPEEARQGGALVLYSLAHGAIAGAATLPAPPEAIPCP